MTSLLLLVPTFVSEPDKLPKPEDVKAGWIAFAFFIGLIVAVALLGMSLTRHLRKARDSAEQGRFDPSDPRRSPTS